MPALPGFIGSALKQTLKQEGHNVFTLGRRKDPKEGEIYLDPVEEILNPKSVEGFDAWINLAGENINGRWNEAKKKKILESRVKTTKLLAETALELAHPPKTIINASAIGIYGTNRKGEKLTEKAESGDGFLASVCRDWESAMDPAEKGGLRVVKLRLGVVLSPKGGALKKMIFPFKLGLGGQIGDGSQYMSWISLDDLIRIIQFCLINELHGPINCVSPHPVTNKEFTDALAKALHRTARFPVPAFVVRFILGEMADELLLSSIYALPEELSRRNFQFKHPGLSQTLKDFF